MQLLVSRSWRIRRARGTPEDASRRCPARRAPSPSRGRWSSRSSAARPAIHRIGSRPRSSRGRPTPAGHSHSPRRSAPSAPAVVSRSRAHERRERRTGPEVDPRSSEKGGVVAKPERESRGLIADHGEHHLRRRRVAEQRLAQQRLGRHALMRQPLVLRESLNAAQDHGHVVDRCGAQGHVRRGGHWMVVHDRERQPYRRRYRSRRIFRWCWACPAVM